MTRADKGPATVPSPLARLREWLPMLMSVLAFTVSLTSLYYAALRDGQVIAMTGPMLLLSHDPLTGVGNVSVAVNLSNTGARLVTVKQLQLQVTGPDGKTTVRLPAVAQQKLAADGEPKDDVMTAPITLAPRSETSRQLRFTITAKDAEHFAFVETGKYQFQLSLQLLDGQREAEHWVLDLSETEAYQLTYWRGLNIGNTLAVLKAESP
ncbi:hypothetical protein HPT27_03925 [Permianibacter sp. IMCC34836]|uniref:hypothetical protein n=1 Tax=Permianibacter fluminis TaxID=2738515 RepID=UPI0015525C48|nr:hypothetical protein [Permianibacter fluminis]NQD36160.1 hypothetical protein [Permianibacter fluminis]